VGQIPFAGRVGGADDFDWLTVAQTEPGGVGGVKGIEGGIGILISAASRCGADLRPAHRPAGVARPGGEQNEWGHPGKNPRPACAAVSIVVVLVFMVVSAALSRATNWAQARKSPCPAAWRMSSGE
jgi:hypothetical protein